MESVQVPQMKTIVSNEALNYSAANSVASGDADSIDDFASLDQTKVYSHVNTPNDTDPSR